MGRKNAIDLVLRSAGLSNEAGMGADVEMCVGCGKTEVLLREG